MDVEDNLNISDNFNEQEKNEFNKHGDIPLYNNHLRNNKTVGKPNKK